MTTLREAAQQALEALESAPLDHNSIKSRFFERRHNAITALRAALAEPVQAHNSIRQAAKRAGINLPETYLPTMDDAIAAGDGVLMNEQAALLRECRLALDCLLRDKPMLAAKLCGTTTLGNLRAMLYDYRPQGVFGGSDE